MTEDIKKVFDDFVDTEAVYVVPQSEWHRLKKLDENLKKLRERMHEGTKRGFDAQYQCFLNELDSLYEQD